MTILARGAPILAVFYQNFIFQLMALLTLVAENLTCVMQLVLREDAEIAPFEEPLHYKG